MRSTKPWVDRGVPAFVAAALFLLGPTASAQKVYKCGAAFQDQPCASEEVQKRFSTTSGSFSIDQVNPDTSRQCASLAQEAMPYWSRLNRGESVESLRAEINARPVSGQEKSAMRDFLLAIRQYTGTPVQVRSQFEAQCMANTRRPAVVADNRSPESAGGASVAAARAAARAANRAARAAERN